MKPTMMFAVMMITAIVLMISFDISLSTSTSAIPLDPSVAPNVLFVCPVPKNSVWAEIASGLSVLKRPLLIGLFFAVMVLTAVWLWALYQNLLKDKFDRNAFKNPWGFTKMLFWGAVAIFILIRTPDSFRIVHIDGATGDWVLCDNNTPGARAVPADKVHL